MTETNAQEKEKTVHFPTPFRCTFFGFHVWSTWEDKQYTLGYGYTQFRHCLRCNLVDSRTV